MINTSTSLLDDEGMGSTASVIRFRNKSSGRIFSPEAVVVKLSELLGGSRSKTGKSVSSPSGSKINLGNHDVKDIPVSNKGNVRFLIMYQGKK
jgi:hypothetical protein